MSTHPERGPWPPQGGSLSRQSAGGQYAVWPAGNPEPAQLVSGYPVRAAPPGIGAASGSKPLPSPPPLTLSTKWKAEVTWEASAWGWAVRALDSGSPSPTDAAETVAPHGKTPRLACELLLAPEAIRFPLQEAGAPADRSLQHSERHVNGPVQPLESGVFPADKVLGAHAHREAPRRRTAGASATPAG
ncbi:unnamed protein product [Rangifer tarandus platyrhynchus]|uniref:Uncharacterized protein n=2 Tax=Rangifer tarandus platyrhynchus TaxID=3082113 RepID=A0ACB0E6S0_RANTA|nr:unnamed protein product [Rangifer tarandus platyrhynchus]CAI9696029.1 unnamed protein product [Rangifer tarandus platyrhynchus]